MSEIVVAPPAGTEIAVAANPMAMLAHAVQSGASVETLERLMTLQERWEARAARMAYVSAMSKARAKFKTIAKTHAGYQNRYKFESLDDVTEALDEALMKHGFSYEWKPEPQANGEVMITCIMTHIEGHAERATLPADPRTVADAKANMNSVQRLGAVLTYLQRYTLKLVAGVAASRDTDGRGDDEAAPAGPSQEEIAQQIERWSKAINGATTPAVKNIVAKNIKAEGDAIPQAALLELRKLFAARAKALKDAKPQEASDAAA